MNELHDLSINLLAAFIGLSLGWLRGAAAKRFRYRRARGFWRQLSAPDITVVVGQHSLSDWEPSGLLGVGCAFALTELQRHLDRIGIRQPRIVYSERVDDATRGSDLILIGGPDCNKITLEVMTRIQGTLRFDDSAVHTVAICDTREGEIHHPGSLRNGEGTDYGLLIRASNPFNPRASVLIIAGSYGYGTWAGARLVTDPGFLKESLVKAQTPIECLFVTDVAGQAPQATQVLRIRSLERVRPGLDKGDSG